MLQLIVIFVCERDSLCESTLMDLHGRILVSLIGSFNVSVLKLETR